MPNKQREKSIYRVTIIGSIANFILLLFKFAAGVLGHSSAMIADAIHSLSDFATDVVVLIFVKISNKPQDKDHDFGHGKFETLSTAIIGLVLAVVGVGILWSGAVKIWGALHGEALESPGLLALWAALISIVVKEWLFRITKATAKKVDSSALVANAWHHRSDAFSSIGTALGIAGAIFLGEKFRVLDPIAAVIVSFFIIKVAIQLLKGAMDELLEKSLCDDTEGEILTIVARFKEIHDPHNLRTRKIGNSMAIDIHIRVDSSMTVEQAHDITLELEQAIRDKLGRQTYITTHVEPLKK